MMKLTDLTRKASKFVPQDFISNMPDNVVTNILDRLPLQHAVRTSILSRNWRFKWTTLTQLVFDEKFFEYLTKTKGKSNCGGIISRLLLQIKGVVEKFVLSMGKVKGTNDVENINHWILFLSTKSIKDLTLRSVNGIPVKLPTHLFSCLELKHLKLTNCCFHPPHSIPGFPNLLSLKLCVVKFESGILGEILTRCPSLEILDMRHLLYPHKVKLVDFAKSENLKILSLCLYHIDAVAIRSSTIFELVGFLPKLQELDLVFLENYKLTESGATMRFPAACLKALKLSDINLGNVMLLSCVFEMIRHFPNLHTLEITTVIPKRDAHPIPNPIPEVEYNTTGLRSVVFRYFAGSENEVCLIKYILACSPFLEKIVIHSHWSLASDERLMFTMKLLKLRRASTVAEIDFD
ncbi:F-box/FBD/LRR-repeat protein At1g13570-like [Helianthus annuus]|nr:F-box/FBD/LRR-repeat protein At1g13570-like [Helianthus annuus]KAJ0462211.1 putative F-box domain, FBD domain, leucine-rich repeat domain superfamily [Helianthus annuus]